MKNDKNCKMVLFVRDGKYEVKNFYYIEEIKNKKFRLADRKDNRKKDNHEYPYGKFLGNALYLIIQDICKKSNEDEFVGAVLLEHSNGSVEFKPFSININPALLIAETNPYMNLHGVRMLHADGFSLDDITTLLKKKCYRAMKAEKFVEANDEETKSAKKVFGLCDWNKVFSINKSENISNK